jgi:hypothetical protein
MDDEDRHLEVTVAVPDRIGAADAMGAADAADAMTAKGAASPARARRGPHPEQGRATRGGPEPDRAVDPGDDRDRTEQDDDAVLRFGRSTRFGRIDGVKVALALAVTVAVVLAGALYRIQRQSDDERAVTAAIAAYTAAWNAHDVSAVRATMFPGCTFSASDNIRHEPMFTAEWGPDLDGALTKLFGANLTLETRGRVLMAGDSTRASVTQRFRYTVYGLNVVEDGISHYTLSPAPSGTGLRIAQHVWWRPKVPASPSMLWILDAPDR